MLNLICPPNITAHLSDQSTFLFINPTVYVCLIVALTALKSNTLCRSKLNLLQRLSKWIFSWVTCPDNSYSCFFQFISKFGTPKCVVRITVIPHLYQSRKIINGRSSVKRRQTSSYPSQVLKYKWRLYECLVSLSIKVWLPLQYSLLFGIWRKIRVVYINRND